jgi:hypothetical protein
MMATVQAGILFPQALLESRFFVILATIVALNTIVYAGLAVSKIVPRLIRASLFHRAKRRAINRSIYPGAISSVDSRTSTGWPKNQP